MNKTRSILGMAILILLLAARAASALVPAHACTVATGQAAIGAACGSTFVAPATKP